MGPPEQEPIGLHLTRTSKVLSRAFDDALAEAGGSLPVWLILVAIKGQAHGAQRHLAEAVGIESATLTHHLNRLEKAGLVTRTRNPDNRRVHQVGLTETGEAMFNALLAEVVAFDQRLRRGLGDRELTALRRLLDQLAENATETDDDGAVP